MSKPVSTPRELPEEGNHNAICKGVVDLGTQTPSNPDWAPARKILLLFEFPDLSKKDKPEYITVRYTFNAKSKNLAKVLKSWLQVKAVSDFDMADALNKTALLNIVHSEDGQYANIAAITPAGKAKFGKGFISPNSLFLDDSFDAEAFESLPEWIQNIVMESPEYEEVSAPKAKKVAKKVAKK